jgi:hypothetical protein
MNVVHGNSRYGRFVWTGLAVLSLVLFLVARQQEQTALTKQVDEAQSRALLYANTVLYNALRAPTVSTPLTGATYRDLYTDIQGQMFTDTRVARVRLWGADGTLLFSTDERDKIGQLRVNEDPAIVAAVKGTVSSRLTTAPFTKATTGDPGTQTDLFQTFVPLRVPDRIAVLGAVQIDQFYDSLRTAAAGPWKRAQGIFLALTLLFTVLAFFSFRRRPPVAIAEVASAVPGASDGGRDGSAAVAQEQRRAMEQQRGAALSELSERESVATAAVATLSGRVDDLTRRNEELVRTVEQLTTKLEAASAATEATERAAAEAHAGTTAERDQAAEQLAALERQATEAARAIEEAERRAAEAQQRVTDLELELAAARRDAEETAAEALESRTAPGLSAQALELLEARVIAAEERAAQAERRLAELAPDEAPRSNGHAPGSNGHHVEEPENTNGHPEPAEDDEPVSPISAEAHDLRARLARTAAAKKRAAE